MSTHTGRGCVTSQQLQVMCFTKIYFYRFLPLQSLHYLKSVLFSTHTGRGCVTWQQLKVMCLQESILDLYLKSVLISTHTGRVCVPKQQLQVICVTKIYL